MCFHAWGVLFAGVLVTGALLVALFIANSYVAVKCLDIQSTQHHGLCPAPIHQSGAFLKDEIQLQFLGRIPYELQSIFMDIQVYLWWTWDTT